MPGKALGDWLEEAGGSPALRSGVLALARAAVSVNDEIQSGALRLAPSDRRGKPAGVERKSLDQYGHECFLEEISGVPVALFGSGDLELPVVLDPAAPVAVAIDSLDGFANIDTNVPIGSRPLRPTRSPRRSCPTRLPPTGRCRSPPVDPHCAPGRKNCNVF